jgi:hypothetical protein
MQDSKKKHDLQIKRRNLTVAVNLNKTTVPKEPGLRNKNKQSQEKQFIR